MLPIPFSVGILDLISLAARAPTGGMADRSSVVRARRTMLGGRADGLRTRLAFSLRSKIAPCGGLTTMPGIISGGDGDEYRLGDDTGRP